MKRLLAALLALLLAVVLTACENNTDKSSGKTSGIATTVAAENTWQTKLEDILKAENFNGVVRVSQNGKVLCEAANGKKAPGSDENLTVDHQFAIGSVSKQFCAACIMMLKEENKLRVEDTIDRYFPDYPLGGTITVKHLLTMRSGIPDYVQSLLASGEVRKRYDFGETATEAGNRKVTMDILYASELDFAPGTQYAYTDSNYFLLADIVEQISGERYADFLRKRIFKPLGMNDTGVAEELCRSEKLAQPFYETDAPVKEIFTPGLTFGNGGIISTAADVDKWMTALRQRTLISDESFKEMTTDYSPESGHYGYGLFLPSKGVWEHNGVVDTYLTHAYTMADGAYQLFAVTNQADHEKLSEVAAKVKALTAKEQGNS